VQAGALRALQKATHEESPELQGGLEVQEEVYIENQIKFRDTAGNNFLLIFVYCSFKHT